MRFRLQFSCCQIRTSLTLTLSLSAGIAVTSVYYSSIYRLSFTFEITLERSSLRVRRRLGVRKADFFSRNADTVITRFTRGERLTDTVYTVRRGDREPGTPDFIDYLGSFVRIRIYKLEFGAFVRSGSARYPPKGAKPFSTAKTRLPCCTPDYESSRADRPICRRGQYSERLCTIFALSLISRCECLCN